MIEAEKASYPTARVTAWRRLHRLGALYIGPSTCLLPVALADEQALVTVAEGITTAGGGIDTFRIEAFDHETQRMLVARFSADRDAEYAEYAEVIEQADALVAELDRDTRGKFGFAEVEENDADLAKPAPLARGHRQARPLRRVGVRMIRRSATT